MGAWGHAFNANDDAADWLAAFEDAPSWTMVAGALKLNDGHIEAVTGSEAVAAAELVAAGLGKPHAELAPELADWAAENSQGSELLREPARKALATLLNGSELQELWDETGDTTWRDEIADLQARLN